MLRTNHQESEKGLVKHHVLPVGFSVETVDWHLRHLFANDSGFLGFETIEMITEEEHRETHKRLGYGQGY